MVGAGGRLDGGQRGRHPRPLPRAEATDEVQRWLSGIGGAGSGRSPRRYDGRGWWSFTTRAGPVPRPCARARAGRRTPARSLTRGGRGPARLGSARWTRPPSAACSAGAGRRPAARAAGLADGIAGAGSPGGALGSRVGAAFERLPGAAGGRAVPTDPWLVEQLDEFLARHRISDRRGRHRPGPAASRARRGRCSRAGIARDRRRADSRGRASSAASSSPFSGPACAMPCGRAAPFWPTSRGWARRCRPWPPSRPTRPSRPSSCARPR